MVQDFSSWGGVNIVTPVSIFIPTTPTTITGWNNAVGSGNGAVVGSTGSSNITVVTAGDYSVTVTINYSAFQTATVFFNCYINGVATSGSKQTVNQTYNNTVTISFINSFSSEDVVDVRINAALPNLGAVTINSAFFLVSSISAAGSINGIPVSGSNVDDGYTLMTVGGSYVQTGVVPVFNVKNFGATGNGSTDDTAAIQAALNAGIANHGSVYFPEGMYACNALNINYAQGMTVRGERSSYSLSGASTGSVIKWTGGSTGTLLTLLDCQELHFEFMHFYGQNNQVDHNNFGVNVSSDNDPASYFVSFERCVFSEFGTCVTWGVNPFQCDKGGIFNSEFWYYTRYGLYVGSANALDAGEIKGCTFTGAPGNTFLPLVATSGTAPPAVTLTGSPSAGTVRIDMNITTPGSRGTALFTWKLNGVTQQTGQTTAATFALGATGLTLNFPAATYFSDDVYEAFATNAVGIYLFWCGLMRISDCLGGGYHKYFIQVNTSLANNVIITDCESETGPGSWQFYFSGGNDATRHTLIGNTITSGLYIGGTSCIVGIGNTYLYGGSSPVAGVMLDGAGAKYMGWSDRFTALFVTGGTTGVITANGGIYHNQDLSHASAFGELWTLGQITWQPPYQDETGNAAEQCVRSGRRAQFWQENTAYPAGDYIVPTVDNGHVYYTVNGGTSNATTQPIWTTGGGDTQPTDGTIVWIEDGYAGLFQPFGPLNHFTGTAPPTTGYHTIGAIFWNTAPGPFGGSQIGGANSTYIGWVCTASGAPGTWYPFGNLVSNAPNQIPTLVGNVNIPFGYTYWDSASTLSGNVDLILSPAGTLGAEWIIDATNVVLNGFTITAKLNGQAWSTTIGTTDIYYLREGGTGQIFGFTLTP